MPSALICGSIAYDSIMVFPDQFKNHILPDQVHILNVSFLVPKMRREFGGCAGNIAYNLKLLGGEGYPVATVGQDFAPYRERFEALDIPLDRVKVLGHMFTAQAFITTDLDDNQITAFHPGAMGDSHQNDVTTMPKADIGIVAPDGGDGMKQHAEGFAATDTPFIFDPGQAMPLFNGDEFRHFIDLATWVTVNSYESKLLEERTGWSAAEIASRVKAYIVTEGGKGVTVHQGGESFRVPAVDISGIADPTGCGDAFRGGLLFGLMHDYELKKTVQLASLMGGIKIEHEGTQNHAPSRDEIAARFEKQFGDAL
ncbi:MAG: sugar kinase [Lysobacteraceae bacterium]|nr:MAG: sugar kinase [Xanthomonadaceae bacterium]